MAANPLSLAALQVRRYGRAMTKARYQVLARSARRSFIARRYRDSINPNGAAWGEVTSALLTESAHRRAHVAGCLRFAAYERRQGYLENALQAVNRARTERLTYQTES